MCKPHSRAPRPLELSGPKFPIGADLVRGITETFSSRAFLTARTFPILHIKGHQQHGRAVQAGRQDTAHNHACDSVNPEETDSPCAKTPGDNDPIRDTEQPDDQPRSCAGG